MEPENDEIEDSPAMFPGDYVETESPPKRRPLVSFVAFVLLILFALPFVWLLLTLLAGFGT